jgi:hypothetical protein
MGKKTHEIFRAIRRMLGKTELIGIYGSKSASLIDRWCLPCELDTDTGARNPLDRMSLLINRLREDGLHHVVRDMQITLFPEECQKAKNTPQETALYFTTSAQQAFIDLQAALADGRIDDDEWEQITQDIEELKIQIANIEGLRK